MFSKSTYGLGSVQVSRLKGDWRGVVNRRFQLPQSQVAEGVLDLLRTSGKPWTISELREHNPDEWSEARIRIALGELKEQGDVVCARLPKSNRRQYSVATSSPR